MNKDTQIFVASSIPHMNLSHRTQAETFKTSNNAIDGTTLWVPYKSSISIDNILVSHTNLQFCIFSKNPKISIHSKEVIFNFIGDVQLVVFPSNFSPKFGITLNFKVYIEDSKTLYYALNNPLFSTIYLGEGSYYGFSVNRPVSIIGKGDKTRIIPCNETFPKTHLKEKIHNDIFHPFSTEGLTTTKSHVFQQKNFSSDYMDDTSVGYDSKNYVVHINSRDVSLENLNISCSYKNSYISFGLLIESSYYGEALSNVSLSSLSLYLPQDSSPTTGIYINSVSSISLCSISVSLCTSNRKGLSLMVNDSKKISIDLFSANKRISLGHKYWTNSFSFISGFSISQDSVAIENDGSGFHYGDFHNHELENILLSLLQNSTNDFSKLSPMIPGLDDYFALYHDKSKNKVFFAKKN